MMAAMMILSCAYRGEDPLSAAREGVVSHRRPSAMPSNHGTDSLVQVQRHLEQSPLDSVPDGDGEGAFGQGHAEALPPGLELV